MQTITQFFNNVAASAFRNTPRGLWERHVKKYNIPYANFLAAYRIDKDILRSFNGQGRWLVGDGWHYLDTGVKVAATDKVIAKMMYDAYNEDKKPFGAYSGVAIAVYQSKWRPYSKTFYTGPALVTDKISTITIDETTYDIDGTSITISRQDSTKSALIFAINNNGAESIANAHCKFGSIQIADSHYYIPIKLTDGTCTMLDLMDDTHTPLEVKGTTGKGFTIEQ